MPDITLGWAVKSYQDAPAQPAYSGVRITYMSADGDPLEYLAGTETGTVIEFEFPWTDNGSGGNQIPAIAASVLAQLRGKTYFPFQASGAILNPAAELGDSISVGNVVSVLASRNGGYRGLAAADIAAPWQDDGSNEMDFQSPIQRSIRNIGHTTTRLSVETGRIEARVETAEGNISTLTQTASSLTTRITSAEGDISTLEQSVSGLSSTVSSHTGSISTLAQTATSLTTRMTNAEGDISDLEQTTSGLSSTVSGHTGSISTLNQTTSAIIGQVTDSRGNYTVLNLKSDGLHVGNASGTTKIAGSSVQAASLQLTDNISFNTVASTASGAASTAASAASDAAAADALARALAGGTPIAASVGTFINGRNIYSPNIYTNLLTIQPPAATEDWSGGLDLKGYFGSRLFDMFRISYFQGDGAYVIMSSPARAFLRMRDFTAVEVESTVKFHAPITINSYGTAAPSGSAEPGQLYFQIAS